jgi:hypothetical protein
MARVLEAAQAHPRLNAEGLGIGSRGELPAVLGEEG